MPLGKVHAAMTLVHAPHYTWQATTVAPGADTEARAVIDRLAQDSWAEHRRLQQELEALLERLNALQAETAGASVGQEPVDMGSVRIRLRRLRVTAKEVTGRLEGVE